MGTIVHVAGETCQPAIIVRKVTDDDGAETYAIVVFQAADAERAFAGNHSTVDYDGVSPASLHLIEDCPQGL